MNAVAALMPVPDAAMTVDAYPGDESALLGTLVRYFEEAETATAGARRLSERDRDFKDGKQLTAEEVATLKKRRQPVVWNNIIGRKIDLLRGIERRARSDPKAFPRTPTEETRADVATQVLRYICDDQRFDVTRSAVFDNMLVEGFGGGEVIVEPDYTSDMFGTSALTPPGPSGYNVIINHIPWERLFYDPHSQHPGFTDASYLGMVIWMDRADALDRYPGCDGVLAETFDGARFGTYDDKPQSNWCDNQRRRARVVQIWWKRGRDWWAATLTKGGFLEQPMRSPYMDRHGNATCPLILRSARIDRENNRFGVVRDMVPLQEMVNKRESKLTHAINVNQILMEEGAVADVEKARAEAARPDGVIVRNKGFDFAIHKDQAEIAGQFQLLQYSIAQMNVAGPNASMAGKDPREQSGRAIIAQQAGGQVEHEPIADELRQWTHKVMEAAWMRARQFWTTEKTIRVTDEDKDVQFVTLNRQVTLADELKALSPDQAQVIASRMMLRPGDPRLAMVVRVEHALDDLDVDITIEEGPDSPTQASEAVPADHGSAGRHSGPTWSGVHRPARRRCGTRTGWSS